jgi:general secretion pathway protein G
MSLLELLIVVVIILTVAALAIPSLLASVNQARVAKAAGDMRTIQEEISLYQNSYQILPDDLSQVGYGNYQDPWGNLYQYFNLATLKGNGMARTDRFLLPLNEDYELYSMGKDGSSSPPITAANSLDDVVRAGNGSYVGLGSLY